MWAAGSGHEAIIFGAKATICHPLVAVRVQIGVAIFDQVIEVAMGQ